MSLLGAFSVGYPVVFRSGGDTTRVAFGKHIQEIERIYGILNALDSDKVSSSDLDGKLGNFKPDMNFSDITGNLDISRITGNLDASRVIGKLSNANIDASNVNGLHSLVTGIIPTPQDKGDGITDMNIKEENGYVKFKNGLILQWGVSQLEEPDRGVFPEAKFPKPFPFVCLNVILSLMITDLNKTGLVFIYLNGITTTGYTYYVLNSDSRLPSQHFPEVFDNAYVRFFAIGY